MASITFELTFKNQPFLRVYDDGTMEQHNFDSYVPPSPDQDLKTGVSSKDITISDNPNISALLYLLNIHQNRTPKLPILVYFHGGGFYDSSAFGGFNHRYLNRLNPLPITYEDCWDALQWVASQGSNKDSAGNKEPLLVNYGDFDRLYIGEFQANWVHMRAGVESLCDGSSKPIGSEPKGEDFEKNPICKFWDFVYPSAPGRIDNPMVNPVGEGALILAGLACSRLLVCVARKDKLRDQGVWYYDLVKESGWKGEVELFEVEGDDHCFHFISSLRLILIVRMLRRCSNAWGSLLI
ncbi:hypothetical protein ACFX1X_022370 [Malus domestica]